jgi:hypothetical protein
MRTINVRLLILVSLLVTQLFVLEANGDDVSFSVEELKEGSTYVVLCARGGGDGWLEVARRLASAREARAIVRFDSSRPGDLLPTLTKLAPENVAYVIPPKLITPDLAGRLAELSSRIRPDKMIDYASGYVTGVTADDAMELIDRTLAREAEELPVPRVCTGVGHSWHNTQRNLGDYFVMASRELGRGPTLRLTDEDGEFKILGATADVSLSERTPDQNFQKRGLNKRLIVSPAYGSCVLIDFDLDEEQFDDPNRRALLEIPVDNSRWKFDGNMVVGVSPIETAWKEDSATWNDAPDFSPVTTTRAPADGATNTVTVDVTALLKRMQHGIAVFCHSADEETETKIPLRHMYHFMARYVSECRQRGFEGTAVEALAGDEWTANHLDWLRPISEGGLILFGGHGSASSSCLVNLDDLTKLEIGPSVVLNGTCYGATTHQIMRYGHETIPQRELGTIDPSESFALQLLRRGSLGCIGGSTTCSFGHVDPAIALLRDEHKSLGQTIQAIQNRFIEAVPVEKWDAGGMQSGDPGFAKIDRKIGDANPTLIQYTIRTICLGDPAFVPFPERVEIE